MMNELGSTEQIAQIRPEEIIFPVDEIVKIQDQLLTIPSADTSVWFPIPLMAEVNYQSRIDIAEIQITDKYTAALLKYLDQALNDFTGFSKQRCNGFTVGLSGGIDSAVVTKLLNDYCYMRGFELQVLIMGEGDHTQSVDQYKGTPAEWIDVQYAKLMCKDLNIQYQYLDISDDLLALQRNYLTSWARAGQRPRIRANHLYAMAEEHDTIAVGATNGSEFILAAFSTGGPAGNIAPIIDLYKSEVYAVARDIGVPRYIQTRIPLISELNVADSSFYGGSEIDSTVIDPIIRRLWYQKQSPEEVALALGHASRWISDINDKRIIGEACRRGYKSLLINRGFKYSGIEPDLFIDRSYFP